MSKDMVPSASERAQVPEHITFGFADATTQYVDDFVTDARGRLDEKVPLEAIEELEAEVLEQVAEALPYELTAADREDLVRQERRVRILLAQRRRRRFGRPVLSFASISYPRRDY